MFTGIVSEVGKVRAINSEDGSLRLTIECVPTLEQLRTGESLAINGVCLTVIELLSNGFVVQVVSETLKRSNLGGLEVGHRVDLERSVAADGRFDGHIVQGHIDGVGTLIKVESEGNSKRVRIGLEGFLAPYLVEKGSVAIDGVSLTITAVAAPQEEPLWFEVVLIPHTINHTVLGSKSQGDRVNIECDVLAKHVERIIGTRR